MKLLTVKQVADKLSCVTSNVYRMQRLDPTFPKSIVIGMGSSRARGVRWVDSEIDDWLLVKMSHKTSEVQTNEDRRDGLDVHSGAREEVAA